MTSEDDIPLRLADALAVAFPYGGMTVSGLRREWRRGNLEIERIAGKLFTTVTAINRMRERCRTAPKDRDCGSSESAAGGTAKPSKPSGCAAQPGDLVDLALAKVGRLEAENERLRAIVAEYRACQNKIDCLARAARW